MNVDAYFDKPLDARRLLAKVAELLAARHETGASPVSGDAPLAGASADAAAPQAAQVSERADAAPAGGAHEDS